MGKTSIVKKKSGRGNNKKRHFGRLFRITLLACGFLGLMLPTGCRTGSSNISKVEEFFTPAHRPQNYSAADSMPENIHRVVVLPIFFEAYEGDFLEAMGHEFVAALNRASKFEVVVVSREQLLELLGKPQVASVELLPTELFDFIKLNHSADAVLFTDLTHYEPYRPIALGIRSKLVGFENKNILWAFDHVFNSSHPAVSLSARRYQNNTDLSTQPLQTPETILRSPRQFSRYVAAEVFSTLPGR